MMVIVIVNILSRCADTVNLQLEARAWHARDWASIRDVRLLQTIVYCFQVADELEIKINPIKQINREKVRLISITLCLVHIH